MISTAEPTHFGCSRWGSQEHQDRLWFSGLLREVIDDPVVDKPGRDHLRLFRRPLRFRRR
jgi:hypothetical protein